MKDPQTPAEWQEAVDGAEFLLLLDAAVKYGLVKYNGRLNVERCEQIIARGRERGIQPKPTDELIKLYVGG